MIAVERRNDPQIGRDRLQFAKLDRSLGEPQRLHEPRDLHLGETLRRVEPPFSERSIDFTPDRRGAGLHNFCDLAAAVACRHQVEIALTPRNPALAPRAAFGSKVKRRGQRCGISGHGLSVAA